MKKNIEILKYIKLVSKNYAILKLVTAVRVLFLGYLYSVRSMYTNTCRDLCGPKRHRQDEV